MKKIVLFLSMLLLAPTAFAAKGKAKAGKAPAPAKHAAPTATQQRAMSELMGRFKWGMSVDDVFKTMADDISKRTDEALAKELEVYRQDQLRKQRDEDIEKVKATLIKFDGQKTGWDVSIIDREFGHKNDESMIVAWEPNQRRFLFFKGGKLYKQFIAFNAEHPAFSGKTFDDFGKLLTARYGHPEMKFEPTKTKEDMTLSHLEWPASGDTTLWAVDRSSFYGNFCLVLRQTAVANSVDKARPAVGKVSARTGSTLIDTITKPAENQTDPNADIIDQITGKDDKTKPQK